MFAKYLLMDIEDSRLRGNGGIMLKLNDFYLYLIFLPN